MDKNRKTRLLDALADHPLLGDGAMGTQLMIAGLEQGNCGEAWNLTHPERVLAIQQRYAEAGSDCILTNTFGGSRIMLNRHSQAGRVVEINRAGVRIAREAFGGKRGFVIGDMGPFGGLLEPYGDFTEEQVRSAFNEQARALVDAGADAIIVETQTSLEELLLGIEAAKQAGAPYKPAANHASPTANKAAAKPENNARAQSARSVPAQHANTQAAEANKQSTTRPVSSLHAVAAPRAQEAQHTGTHTQSAPRSAPAQPAARQQTAPREQAAPRQQAARREQAAPRQQAATHPAEKEAPHH